MSSPPKINVNYYLLFALSGFAGLIYQSIWSHYLKLFLGHAAYAQTLVIVIFMGGMGLGAFVAGRLAHRINRPILIYASVEVIIAFFGFLFDGVFGLVERFTFSHWIPYLHASYAQALIWIDLSKWGLAALLILPQSILLGTTFPLLASGLTRKYPNSQGRTIALLYFVNSLGASFGILLNSFVLINYFGLPGAITIAAFVNLILAIIFYYLSVGDVLPSKLSQPNQKKTSAPYFLLFIAAFTGAASFMYEIAWVRMLSMVFGASTHSFELMLSSFILGLAIGGYLIRSRLDSHYDLRRTLAYIQITMGLLAVCTIPVYDQFFDFMVWLQAQMQAEKLVYWQFNVVCYGMAIFMMLPATICAGATLPIITTSLMKKTENDMYIGKVYAFNTIGSILGVVAAVQFVMPQWGLKAVLVTGGSIDILLGLLIFFKMQKFLRIDKLLASATIATFTVLALSVNLDYLKMASGAFRGNKLADSENTEILYSRDGKTSTVQILNQFGYYSISNNGENRSCGAGRW